MKKNISKSIYWIPRILSMIFVGFLFLMSLDIFELKLSFWQTVLGLFIHSVPALILLVALIVSWKYEIVGGITFISGGILYIVIMLINVMRYQFEWYMLSYSFIVAGPAFLIGVLFMINWTKKENRWQIT